MCVWSTQQWPLVAHSAKFSSIAPLWSRTPYEVESKRCQDPLIYSILSVQPKLVIVLFHCHSEQWLCKNYKHTHWLPALSYFPSLAWTWQYFDPAAVNKINPPLKIVPDGWPFGLFCSYLQTHWFPRSLVNVKCQCCFLDFYQSGKIQLKYNN